MVLVDDSLVRGNTLAQLVPLLRRGGATEVHVRISSPPLLHPCYMGVDIGSHAELIAHQLGGDVARICASIGADSLGYLSLDGMLAAVREGIPAGRLDHTGQPIGVGHCSACFTGGASAGMACGVLRHTARLSPFSLQTTLLSTTSPAAACASVVVANRMRLKCSPW